MKSPGLDKRLSHNSAGHNDNVRRFSIQMNCSGVNSAKLWIVSCLHQSLVYGLWSRDLQTFCVIVKFSMKVFQKEVFKEHVLSRQYPELSAEGLAARWTIVSSGQH